MSCEKLVVGVSCALQSGGCRSNVASSHLMSPYPRCNHTAPSSVSHAATLLSDGDRRRWPRPLALPAGIGTATLRTELEEANLGVMPVRQRGHEAVSRKGTLTPRLARSSHAPWIDDDVAFLNTYISSPAERLLSRTPSSPTITTTPAFSSHFSQWPTPYAYLSPLFARLLTLYFLLLTGRRQGRVPPDRRRFRQRLAQHRRDHERRRRGRGKSCSFFPLLLLLTCAQETKYTIKNDNTGKETTYKVSFLSRCGLVAALMALRMQEMNIVGKAK
jgi:hypothetical protein